MEWLSKTYRQLVELVLGMSPAMRVTTGLLLGVVVLSSVALLRWKPTAPDTYLFGGRVLTDREIARLEAAFSKAALNDWEAVGNRIRVPRAKRFQYIAAAADEGALPEDFDTILEEMIKSSGPFEPRELRDMRMKYAQQLEIARVIQAMQGIERATVKFAETPANGLRRESKKTAVVAALASQNRMLSREQVEAIRTAAAMGLGIPPENVVVTDLRGVSYPGKSAHGMPSVHENIYAAHKQMYEKYYQEKIAESLAMIPGVLVGVNVELDPKLNQTTQTRTYNQPQPIRSSNSSIKTTTRSGTDAGRVGAVPNGALGNRAEEVSPTSSTLQESTSSETREESESVVGQEWSDVVQAGLTPTTVTATVQIPQSYFRRIWMERNPPKPGESPREPDQAELLRIENEEINRIKESVQHLIPGLAPGKDPYPRVYVRSFVDTRRPETPAPSWWEQWLPWLEAHWGTLAALALGAVALFWARSLVRTASVAPAPLPVPESILESITELKKKDEASHVQPTETPPQPRLKRITPQAGPSLRDELADLVREDPDAAAAVLSAWIGDTT